MLQMLHHFLPISTAEAQSEQSMLAVTHPAFPGEILFMFRRDRAGATAKVVAESRLRFFCQWASFSAGSHFSPEKVLKSDVNFLAFAIVSMV
jgi:hypothetical protein